jgi:hypothetical protein
MRFSIWKTQILKLLQNKNLKCIKLMHLLPFFGEIAIFHYIPLKFTYTKLLIVNFWDI